MANSHTISHKPWIAPELANATRPARVLGALVSVYQRLRVGRVSACRFFPSCSEYALEALVTHGALRGTGLAIGRLSKCRPLGPHGVDLVPLPKKARSSQS
jgi:putative membrane protein insertion efficiency factor